MYKFLFEILTDPLGLPINPLWEYGILLALNELAFQIAWDASPGGIWGSEIHWSVRISVFVLLWAITYACIAVAKWVYANWMTVLIGVSGVAIVAWGIYLYIRCKREGGDNHA